MMDKDLKEIVLQHDNDIKIITKSIEKVTQKLEKIAEEIAKQTAVKTKIESMEKEIVDSFRRVHNRIDELYKTQNGDIGCSSVKILRNDIDHMTKEMTRLIGITEEHRLNIDNLNKNFATLIKPATIKWAITLGLGYAISFGAYVVVALGHLNETNAKLTTLIEQHSKEINRVVKRVDRYGFKN